MVKLTKRDDMAVQIVFVRHGESYGNIGLPTPEGYSEEDTPLTEYGLKQADALADYWFDGIDVAKIYASPFTRTVQTIYPTAKKLGKPIVLLPDLLEVGSTTGGAETDKLTAEFPLCIPCLSEPSIAGGSLLLPLPETKEQTKLRAERFVNFIARTYSGGETVVVATHGTFFSYLVRAALNAQGENCFNSQIDNSAVTVVALRANEPPLLRTANNTSHLR